MIDQLGIAATGVTAIFLTQSKRESLRRYACLFGMAGQPFWFYSAISAQQWGVTALCCLYTFAWAKGVWQHWIRQAKPISNPLVSRCYTMSQPHLSGHRVILGFDTLTEAQKAHEYIVNVPPLDKATTENRDG